MSFKDRLKEQRESIGMSRIELAEILGVTQAAIGNYENGISTPKADILFKVFDALKCDANYLFQDEMKELTDPIILSVTDRNFLKRYNKLDATGKHLIDLLLDTEVERVELLAVVTADKTKEKQAAAKATKKAASSYTPVQRHYPKGVIPLDSYHENDEYNDMITLPIYDAGASAGTGVFLDSTYYETAAMPNTSLTQRANFAVWVEGDSMEPRFHNGDLVLVRTQPTVDIGEIGIFVVNGEGFIKKLGENKLISLNPDYDDIELNEYDEVYCKGKVLGRAQQILSEGSEY